MNTLRSKFEPKLKPGPHVDGIVVSASDKPIESVTNQMKSLSINQPKSGQATDNLIPLKRWMYILCNLRTRRETNSTKGIRRKEETIVRVGTKT